MPKKLVSRISKIVNEERGISAETALRLARYFGMSSEFWMNLQSRYDLRVAQQQGSEMVQREVRPRELARSTVAERNYRLRLKGGFQYRRQLASFRSMCSGDAKYGELDLYQAGGYLLCKMVAWLPRREAQERSGALYVRTINDALIAAFNAKDEELWRYNADQVLRWAAEQF